MTIRQRITILIAGAGFLASLAFSGVVFWQMLEQPLRIIDSELEMMGRIAAKVILRRQEESGPSATGPSFIESDHYWLKLYDQRLNKTIK